MRPAFDPLADWPGNLPTVADQPYLQAAKRRATEEACSKLPGAAQLYCIERWLEQSAAATLLADLLACVVAADCWNARAVAPRGTQHDDAWTEFLRARLELLGAPFQSALTRWAVLARIPVQWIPEQHVRAQVVTGLKSGGLQAEITELRLVAPFAGGHEWVRSQCLVGFELLRDTAQQRTMAAILYWKDTITPAVITSNGDELRVFGPSFSREGRTIKETELVGADIVESAIPPLTWLGHCARAVRLDGWVWQWQRGRRLRHGGHSLVPA